MKIGLDFSLPFNSSGHDIDTTLQTNDDDFIEDYIRRTASHSPQRKKILSQLFKD